MSQKVPDGLHPGPLGSRPSGPALRGTFRAVQASVLGGPEASSLLCILLGGGRDLSCFSLTHLEGTCSCPCPS